MTQTFLTSINGLLLLSSVTIVYIVNVDKNQIDYLKEIKDYYRNNLQAKISDIVQSNASHSLKDDLKKFQETADINIIEDPCFHKKVGYNIVIYIPKIFSKYIKVVTHFDVLMGLLGVVILICALSHLFLCTIPLLKESIYTFIRDYALIIAAVPLFFIILLVMTFTIGAHLQRCKFDEFRGDCKKRLLLIEFYSQSIEKQH